MKHMRPDIAGLALVFVMVTSGAASAASVTISGSAVAFTPGSGFGVEGGETIPAGLPNAGTVIPGGQGGTLLDVVFSVSSTPVTVVLPGVGASLSGVFGTVQLRERFIDAAEIDNLSISADISMSLPFSGMLNVVGAATATAGIVPPLLGEPVGAVDLTIDWTPLDVPFGNGGLFRVEFDTLTFDTVALPSGTTTLNQLATVTLLAAPIPEPTMATLAIAGLLLIGLRCNGRRLRTRRSSLAVA